MTVAQPGLPPPYGEPKTKSFTTPSEVARATASLNAFHITRRPVSNSSQGCGGGSQVVITVVIGFGYIIPKSCIAGVNDLTIGFAASIAGGVLAYVVGVRDAVSERR